MKLQIGDIAPDFKTTCSVLGTDGKVEDKPWRLSEEIQKTPVLLVFYPGDFTSVCTKQLCDYRDNWGSLKRHQVQVVGISTNSKDSHQNFIKANEFPFPLLDDSEKRICSAYDMLMFIGMANRGLVLVGSNGKVKYYFKEILPFFKRKASEVSEILQKHL